MQMYVYVQYIPQLFLGIQTAVEVQILNVVKWSCTFLELFPYALAGWTSTAKAKRAENIALEHKVQGRRARSPL